MRSLLVAGTQRPFVENQLGLREGWTPVGDGGGVYKVDLDDDAFEQVRSACRGLPADRLMHAPVTGGPVVHGQPMDFHGEGSPLPTRRRLRERTDSGENGGSGEGVLVGMVDTGVRSHPWLSGAFLAAAEDFEPLHDDADHGADQGAEDGAAGDARFEVGHGTFITGLVLQQAPAAGVWVERALGGQGAGRVDEVVSAATQLVRRGVRVLNLSLGCRASDREAREVMRQMIDDLQRINPDLVIVAAAGNTGGAGDPEPGENFWPATDDRVVAVGAVEGPDKKQWAPWSNRGPWIDLAAPASSLLSTYVVGVLEPTADAGARRYSGWARWSGTSFATAVVSGAIAHLMNGPDRMSAQDAVAELRAGRFATGWTDPEKEVPSVPVVRLRTWDEQAAAGN